ncbi:hypothetical protein MC885_020678 [Smutsia gigantea]|nr:hypothetical protein MC885_020678 [Smutsia gigantea]
MPSRSPVSDWSECSSSAEPPAVTRTEGGVGRSAGHSYYQNSKDTDKDGHRVNSHIAKLQELWKTPLIQTIHIPKSMTDVFFLKHSDLTVGQEHYLCSIAKIYNANHLRMLMKRQYVYMIQHSSQKTGRSRLSSRYSQRQHYPCTMWRHQLERVDSGPTITVASAREVVIQHSLRWPGRSKEGFKTGYASKTRCKSLKIFRKPGRLFIQSVSANDSELHVNEEKKEDDLLNKCMQSLSIEEQGEQG